MTKKKTSSKKKKKDEAPQPTLKDLYPPAEAYNPDEFEDNYDAAGNVWSQRVTEITEQKSLLQHVLDAQDGPVDYEAREERMTAKSDDGRSMVKRKYDYEYITQLARTQASAHEISQLIGVDPSALYRAMKNDPMLAQALQQGWNKGKEMIRTKQFEVAMTGSERMLIHLGEVYCGQKTPQELHIKGDVDIKANNWLEIAKQAMDAQAEVVDVEYEDADDDESER